MSASRSFQPTAQTLSGIGLFKGLSIEDREEIAERCEGLVLPAGAELFPAGDPSRDVYCIVSGLVRVTTIAGGKEVSFTEHGPSETVGLLAAIDGAGRSASALIVESASILKLSEEQFWAVFDGYQSVSRGIMKDLVDMVRRLSDRVVEFSTASVRQRIHAELLRLAEVDADGSQVIEPMPRHADIASRISTHREAVSRELSQLESDGVLERGRNRVVIKDPARLAETGT